MKRWIIDLIEKISVEFKILMKRSFNCFLRSAWTLQNAPCNKYKSDVDQKNGHDPRKGKGMIKVFKGGECLKCREYPHDTEKAGAEYCWKGGIKGVPASTQNPRRDLVQIVYGLKKQYAHNSCTCIAYDLGVGRKQPREKFFE